ncbi:AMP-binding protein [Oceanibacterium hippocampi]|uniref:Long-chain-fatty-acid--CoA ligase n=1 Tax=Oceanibacterium hippocampi TaxID=745714 RepID=A0A1Y5RM68_9PROT|nr:AMP-binding protein [Oceanibacterium hippocampi]SLN18163.1 Long-chain-fatty-acid--CoA ligase [Oceanibacterium hippocampi]
MVLPWQEGLTGASMVLRSLARWRGRTAFSGAGGKIRYEQAYDLIGRYQAAMQAAGARRGQRFASLSPNRADAWLAGVAASGLGLATTPLHPLGALDDHQFILDDAEIDFLLVDSDAFPERGAALAGGVERLHGVFTLGPADYGIDINAAAEAAGAVSPVDLAEPGDVSTINYTGGTTGKSKGVLRRHPSGIAMSNAVIADFEWPARLDYLAVAPISHVAGTKIVPTLHRGGCIHLMQGFDPERVLATIAAECITATVLVPTMIYLLLDCPALDRTDLSSLELLLYGASPMSPTRLLEGLERLGPVFSQLYGQTEGYPISVLRREDHDPARPRLFASCGHPCAATEVALLDDENRPVAPGEVGEISVRAAQVMEEYLKRPEQSAETLAGGWLHTGDMATADEQGYLYIVDRKKDMIVSGGFNLFPREIEDVLSSDPSVAMAAVIGVPDDKWGEAVKAVIVPRAGARPDPKALQELVRRRKGGIYTPKTIDIAEAIPLTPIGKPDKKALRATYWAGRDRQVG